MLRKLLVTLLPLGAMVFFTSTQLDDNGKAGKTNAPGEQSCVNSCHDSYSLNSGPGSISISASGMTGFEYTPGQTYAMTVTVSQNGINLFGVGVEALKSSGANAGTLTVTDAASTRIKTATVGGNSRTNIVHTLNGGATANSKAFNFSWTAPAAGTGNVTFYFSGVAANGNDDNNLDYVYNSSQVYTEACATPAQPGNIAGDVSQCEGVSALYSISPVSGATSYTWTLPSGWSGTSSTESINVTAGSTSGDITVVANNACGAGIASTLAVTANVAPVPTVTVNSSNLADTLISTSGVTYQWYLNSNPISGAVFSTYVPTQNGNYTVAITDGNGCSGNSAIFAYTTLGITNTPNDIQFTVFPNPASDFLIVHAADNALNKEVAIVDVAGNKVISSVLTAIDTKIDLSDVSEGIYFIVVGKEMQRTVTRVFISK